jgi:sugar/nucleoside kinase (ribokinase family)
MSIGGATFDLFLRIDPSTIKSASTALSINDDKEVFALPLGGKIRVDEVIGTCGGGATNTAVGLSRLGCAAGFSGILADDQWGEQLRKNFEKEGVDTSCVTFVEHETSSFSLILSSGSGERVILYDPGTNGHLHDVTFDRETASTVNWVYLNHIQPITHGIQDDLVTILTSEPHPCLTWNPGGSQIKDGMKTKINALLLKHTTLLLLNKEEAIAFSGAKTVRQALHVLSSAGPRVVCITDGKHGSYATDGKQVFFCPVLPAPVVDTTGAGDAFGTGMTWGLLSGKDLPNSLQAGTINAMSVVSAIGAQKGLLTETEMNSKLANVQLPVEVSSL